MSRQQYAKKKGRSWENDVVAFLRDCGIAAERRRLTGVADCGDVSGWPGVVVEAKACKANDLAGWLDEAEAERVNATLKFDTKHVALVIAKRRGCPLVVDGYAVMSPDLAVLALQALLKSPPASADKVLDNASR